MTVENRAFLDIEFSLEKSLSTAWDRTQGNDLVRGIQGALQDDDFAEAHRLAASTSFQAVADTRAGLVDQAMVSAFLLGASFFAGGDVRATSVGSGDEPLPPEVKEASRAFTQSMGINGAQQLRNNLTNVVAFVEASLLKGQDDVDDGVIKFESVQKAALPGLGAALNRAVASGKQVSFGIGANLTTSRLATLGAITQMRARGISSFQRSAVLDERTCPVCRALHGQIFSLTDQTERLISLLKVQDPLEMKAAAPFPPQNAAGLASLAAMTKAQIQERGIDIPPSHPFCRCIILPVGSVPGNQILGPAALRLPRAVVQESFGVTTDVASGTGLLEQLGAVESVGQFGTTLSQVKSTESLFRLVPKGKWTETRTTLHNKIIGDLTKGVRSQAKPKFHMMGGGPASGKSTVLDAGKVKLPKNRINIDSDDIKGRLPEFDFLIKAGDDRAAAFVHEESSYLAKETMANGRLNQMNTVLDGTGDGGWASLTKKVDQFRAAGYEISADYMTMPTDLSVKLAKIRGLKTGRVVPEDVIRGTHQAVSRDFKRAVDKGIFDDVRLWDNTIKDKPRLVFEMEGGVQKIHNQKLWDDFLAKADEGAPTPGLLKVKNTQEMFRNKAGGWDSDRATLHTKIIDDLASGLVPQEKPIFHMMGGGPASGKSTVLDSGKVKLPNGHLKVDSDDIKARLPEYNFMIANGDDRAAAFVHSESSYVGKEVMARGRADQLHTVLDGTGDGGFESLSKKINQFRGAGYRVSADYMTLPTDLAWDIASKRAIKTGRKVPEDTLRATHASVSRDFKEAVDKNMFDDVRLWDNTIKDKPRLVFSMEDGNQVIHNQKLWNTFLDKGKETI